MADGTTALLKQTKPEVGGSNNSWGPKLNGNFEIIDDRFRDLSGELQAGGGAAAMTLATFVGLEPVNGLSLRFRPAVTCAAAATLNVDGFGAKALRSFKEDGTDEAISAGALVAGQVYEVLYVAAANAGQGGWLVLFSQTTALPRTGGQMTGPLTSAVKNHGTLATTTEPFNYADGNTHRFVCNGVVVIDPLNLVEGGPMQINFTYASGGISVTGSTQWELGKGQKSTTMSDLGITLATGKAYRMILEVAAGIRTGVFQ